MQREFNLPVLLKIVYFLIGAGFAIFGILIVAAPKTPEAIVYLFPVITLPLGLAFIATSLRRKVVIDGDTITVTDIFKTTEIKIDEIKGVRIGYKRIVIVPKTTSATPVIISKYTDFSDSAQLSAYMQENFQDLNATEAADEQKNILQDSRLGVTADERQARLNGAKKIAMLYNTLGVIAALFYAFTGSSAATVIAVLYPLLSFVVVAQSKGLIKFSAANKKSIYPSVLFGFIAPGMALFARSLVTYKVYSFDNIWLPFIVVAGIVVILLFAAGINKTNDSMASQAIMILLVSVFYSFGSIWQTNCGFDNSPDHIYKAVVIGRHVNHGRGTSYYLRLGTWGPCTTQKDISVSSGVYYKTLVGDSVKIDLKPGLLHIPWFVVSR